MFGNSSYNDSSVTIHDYIANLFIININLLFFLVLMLSFRLRFTRCCEVQRVYFRNIPMTQMSYFSWTWFELFICTRTSTMRTEVFLWQSVVLVAARGELCYDIQYLTKPTIKLSGHGRGIDAFLCYFESYTLVFVIIY